MENPPRDQLQPKHVSTILRANTKIVLLAWKPEVACCHSGSCTNLNPKPGEACGPCTAGTWHRSVRKCTQSAAAPDSFYQPKELGSCSDVHLCGLIDANLNQQRLALPSQQFVCLSTVTMTAAKGPDSGDGCICQSAVSSGGAIEITDQEPVPNITAQGSTIAVFLMPSLLPPPLPPPQSSYPSNPEGVACPLQWLPLFLASSLSPPTRHRRRLDAIFTTKATLETAVQAFNANPGAATTTYGPIADWDVSAITDMSELFSNLKNFNADISNWSTSSVTNMLCMFQVARMPSPPAFTAGPFPRACCSCAAAGPRPPASHGPHLAPHRTPSFRLGRARQRSTSL